MFSPANLVLTIDNLMGAVKQAEHRWEDLGCELGVYAYLSENVQTSDFQGMADVVDAYVRHYPVPSWKEVAIVLQDMKLDDLANEVTAKYVRGMDGNHDI